MKPAERLKFAREHGQFAFVKTSRVLQPCPTGLKLLRCCSCTLHFYPEISKNDSKHSNDKYFKDLTRCPVCCGQVTDEICYERWNYQDDIQNAANQKPKVLRMRDALFGK